jgi:hypothetical protein
MTSVRSMLVCLATSAVLAGCSLFGGDDDASDARRPTGAHEGGCNGTQVALIQDGSRYLIYPAHEGRTIHLRAGVPTRVKGRGPCAGAVGYGTTRYPRLGTENNSRMGDMDIGPFTLRPGRSDLFVGIPTCAGSPDPQCFGGASMTRMHLVVTDQMTERGLRYVGEHGVVVAVPDSYSTNDVPCGLPNSSTVTFNNDGPWPLCTVHDPRATLVDIVDVQSEQWDARLQMPAQPVTVDGLSARRTPVTCAPDDYRKHHKRCQATLTFTESGVSFLVSSPQRPTVTGILNTARQAR